MEVPLISFTTQNDSLAVWFALCDLEQQTSCALCFALVLSKKAYRSLLDIIYPTYQFRNTYSCALFFAQASGQKVRIFCQVVVFFKLWTNDGNF